MILVKINFLYLILSTSLLSLKSLIYLLFVFLCVDVDQIKCSYIVDVFVYCIKKLMDSAE